MNWVNEPIIPRPTAAVDPYRVWDLTGLTAISGSGQTTVYSIYYPISSDPGYFYCPGFTITTSKNSWVQVSVETWSMTPTLIETIGPICQLNAQNIFGAPAGSLTNTAFQSFLFYATIGFMQLRFKVQQLKFPFDSISFGATPLDTRLVRLAFI